jgi:predicted DNA-binding transcriptional regulator YafY
MSEVSILYTNWKGVQAWRRVKPQKLWFGTTEHHPEHQLLMRALDLDKNETRDFAVRDIEDWNPKDAEIRAWISHANAGA